MTYTETQATIREWGLKTFGKARGPLLISRMLDEVTEMLDVALSARRAKSRQEKIGEEAADILIMLFQVCSAYNVDLLAAVDEKMFKNRQRSWTVTKKGVGRHVKV